MCFFIVYLKEAFASLFYIFTHSEEEVYRKKYDVSQPSSQACSPPFNTPRCLTEESGSSEDDLVYSDSSLSEEGESGDSGDEWSRVEAFV